MPGKKRKIYEQIIFCFLIVSSVYLADRAAKYAIIKLVRPGESIPLIKGFLHITLVNNQGMAFGLLNKYSSLLKVISIAAIPLISLYLFVRLESLKQLERVALCFILGGTCGNVTDRLIHGHVIDFIDFRVWPVFNFADSFITIGAALICIAYFSK